MTSLRRRVQLALIRGRGHYEELIVKALGGAKVSVWIGTANVKELRIEAPIGSRARARGRYISVLELFDSLATRGVELRLLHGGLPSRAFREELRRRPRLLSGGLAMRRCPRVHLKMIAVDGAILYLGSANFTGAGLGAKSDGRRNFEAGIVTDDDVLLDEMQGTFEAIWSGRECGGCGLRSVCPAPIDVLLSSKPKAIATPTKATTIATPTKATTIATPTKTKAIATPTKTKAIATPTKPAG
jgi:phosphatidylserine/phosphatidylglycerophosphate/cardiolipin synthase-like enzyme